MKFGVGLTILIITTILGILLLTETCGSCDNATISFQKNIMVANFGGWILGIVLTIHGYRERRKNKNVETQIKSDELQDLKNRIEELENDESKLPSDTDELTKKICTNCGNSVKTNFCKNFGSKVLEKDKE